MHVALQLAASRKWVAFGNDAKTAFLPSQRATRAQQLGYHTGFSSSLHQLAIKNWLVVWNIFYFPTYWESSPQLTFIFFRGVDLTTKQKICGVQIILLPPSSHISCCPPGVIGRDAAVLVGEEWGMAAQVTGWCFCLPRNRKRYEKIKDHGNSKPEIMYEL